MNQYLRLCGGVLVLLLLPSCLKERAVPIGASFEVTVSEDRTAPVRVALLNESYGADEYEWTFEGGEPSTSRERQPDAVVFREAGEHRIRLVVRNAVEERVSEQIIRIDSAMSLGFDYEIAVNDIAPGVVSIRNTSRGGSSYEWTFEGGEPSTSTEQYPKAVTFASGGDHRISLRVFNGSRYEEISKTFTLQAPMQADFAFEPLPIDRDWEAPLTLQTTNLTIGGLSYQWTCEGARVQSPEVETTSVRFERAGEYHLRLIARNGKEEKIVEKVITIKPNSGLLQLRDLRFGISEARNTIGCFFSASRGGIVTSRQIAEEGLGEEVDFGFFALNSKFGYCYFFAPSDARANAFPAIPNARGASFVNTGVALDDAEFDRIRQARDLDRFTLWAETSLGYFTKANIPHFVLVRTADGRRGVLRIRQYMSEGAKSYALVDVKLEKRTGT